MSRMSGVAMTPRGVARQLGSRKCAFASRQCVLEACRACVTRAQASCCLGTRLHKSNDLEYFNNMVERVLATGPPVAGGTSAGVHGELMPKRTAWMDPGQTAPPRMQLHATVRACHPIYGSGPLRDLLSLGDRQPWSVRRCKMAVRTRRHQFVHILRQAVLSICPCSKLVQKAVF